MYTRGVNGSFWTRTAASAFTSSRRAIAISGFCCNARSIACRNVSVWTSAFKPAAHNANVKVLLSFDMMVLSRKGTHDRAMVGRCGYPTQRAATTRGMPAKSGTHSTSFHWLVNIAATPSRLL